MKITNDEILKLARISRLEIQKHEVDPLRKQLEAVLTYAQRVNEIVSEVEMASNKNINVFREDVIVRSNPDAILQRAPEREADYFVVPAILEK